MGTVRRMLTYDEALSVQKGLNAHGAKLVEDGHFGELSHLALIRFQHDNGLPETGNPDLVTTSALGIPAITTPAPAPPPKLTPNPIVQAIGSLALKAILNQALKGLPMLSGYKTYATAIVLAVMGIYALLFGDLPLVGHVDPGSALMELFSALGLGFARTGAKTEANKVSGQ